MQLTAFPVFSFKFSGTLLLHEKIFWVNVYKELQYNSNCKQVDFNGSGKSVYSLSRVAAAVLLVKFFL